MRIFISLNILILTLIILRFLAKSRISRRAQYAMWLAVPLFIALSIFISIPVKVTSPDTSYSVLSRPAASITDHPALINEDRSAVAGSSSVIGQSTDTSSSLSKTISDSASLRDEGRVQSADSSSSHRTINIKVIYLLGVIAVGSVIVINNTVFAIRTYRRRVRIGMSHYGKLRVYRLRDIRSPFLFGRSIYVDRETERSDDLYKYTLCHEYCHFRQGDSFWPILKYFLVTLLWFDPLIWLAAVLIDRDSELSADERVITMLGSSHKTDYSNALLSLAMRQIKDPSPLLATTAMSGKDGSFLKIRVTNIMHGTRKNVAVILMISILLSAVIGCSLVDRKTVREPSYVSGDSMWYDMEHVLYGEDQKELLGIDEVRMTPLVVTPDLRIFNLAVPVYDNGNYAGLSPTELVSYTPEGELIGTITFDEGYNLYCITMIDGVVKGIMTDYQRGIDKLCTLDFENGIITDERDVTTGSRYPCDGFWQMIYRDGLIYLESQFLENNIYTSVYTVTDLDGNVINEFTIDKKYVRWTVNSDGDFLCMGLDGMGDVGSAWDFFIADKDTGAITDLDVPDTIAQRYDGNSVISGDFVYIMGENKTITRYDPVNKEETVAFDFNCSYADFNDLENCDLQYIDDDYIIFTRNGTYAGQSDDWYGRDVFSLKRAVSNPNEGKQIIRAAIVDYIDRMEGYAISSFNQNDPDYFIMIDPDYYTLNVYWNPGSDFDSYYDAQSYVINELRVAIKDGTGPDIVMNGGALYSLYDDDLFVDLNDMIDGEDGIDRDLYFNSCFEAVSLDGDMYHIPLEAITAGMVIDPDYLPEGANGFTFAEYQSFGEANGFYEMWLPDGQEGIFDGFMMTQLMSFISDDEFDIDNDDFRDLISLTEAAYAGHHNNDHLFTLSLNDFYSIMMTDLRGCTGWDYIGTPSSDGVGPSIYPSMSMGITECASSEEGAWRFIRHALSSAVQEHAYNIPMELNAFDRIAQSWVDYDATQYNRPEIIYPFSDDTVDMIRRWLFNIDSIRLEDPDIRLILDEEMPSYFDADKPIDEVISVIENRVDLILDER